MEHYQLAVIGGGPGGYTAALRAAALGQKTVLLEKEKLGGTCLHHGCIPTKTLFHSAELYSKLKKAQEYGLTAGEAGFSFPRIRERKAAVVASLAGNLARLLNKAPVAVHKGAARLLSPSRLEVVTAEGQRFQVSADKIILAPGSREAFPPITGMDLPGILTSREALDLTEIPSSMAVIGGGVIALELASIMATFGCDVTIIQRSVLLRREDREMVRRLTPCLRKQGIKIMTETALTAVERTEDGFTLTVSARQGQGVLKFKEVLLAVGREPVTGGLGLDAAGVSYGAKGIHVNETMATSVPGVYAVGDAVTPGYFLAHTAAHQGMVAAENAAGGRSVFHSKAIPVCIFTQPVLARVGLTEEEAREQGYDVQVGKFPFSANGKAYLRGETEGIVKIVADGKDGPVLGMHILGPGASDLIQEGTLAVAAGIKVPELMDLIHPHPTLSETVWEAALAIGKSPLHLEHR
jgi:dihydrolipoamide dehydrogenase